MNAFENEAYYDQVLAQRSSPWKVKVIQILADGEWHLREDVVREVAKEVPPGVAWRYIEKSRILQLTRRARQELDPETFEKWKADPRNTVRKYEGRREDNELIRRGQRAVVMSVVGSSNRIIREERKGEVWIKRIPLNERLLNNMTNQMRNYKPE